MAVVPEDGSGLPNANAFGATALITSFWADRGGPDEVVWAALSATQKDQRNVLTTDYIRANPRYRWRGQKKLATQRLPFPRTDLTERDGQAVASTIVPPQVLDAWCFLAPRIGDVLKTLLPDLERGGQVVSKSLVGVYSVTFAANSPVGKTIQYIDGLLAPLLRTADEWDLLEGHAGVLATPAIFDSEFHASGFADNASAPPGETVEV